MDTWLIIIRLTLSLSFVLLVFGIVARFILRQAAKQFLKEVRDTLIEAIYRDSLCNPEDLNSSALEARKSIIDLLNTRRAAISEEPTKEQMDYAVDRFWWNDIDRQNQLYRVHGSKWESLREQRKEFKEKVRQTLCGENHWILIKLVVWRFKDFLKNSLYKLTSISKNLFDCPVSVCKKTLKEEEISEVLCNSIRKILFLFHAQTQKKPKGGGYMAQDLAQEVAIWLLPRFKRILDSHAT
jgi:hypothetical protein